MTSVRAAIRGSSGVPSKSRNAAQQPAYPTGSHESSVSRADADAGRIRGEERRREEPLHRRVEDRGHAAVEDGAPPRLHARRVGDARRGVGQHQDPEPMAGVRGDPLADHPTERQPDPGDTIEPEPIEQRERVAAEPLDGVVPGRCIAAAVAAMVVAQDPAPCGERRDLRVPHRVIEPQRMGQDDHGLAGRALEPVVTADVVELCEGHGQRGSAGDPSAAASRRCRRISAAPR